MTRLEPIFTSFPKTEPPPSFVGQIIDEFQAVAKTIDTEGRDKGLRSNEVLRILGPGLRGIGFAVEDSKTVDGIIRRPVFFGENGAPELQYQIDAFHDKWNCGLEVEAGRAWMGNAVYRDLIQAMVMVQVDHLCLAVPKAYKYKSQGKDTISLDYQRTVAVANALYGHSRLPMPYGLTVIGY
jgi:hypothetical protein